MFGLGWPELLVLGIIAVLLFGRKLPDMAKYLGKSVIEFKKGMHGLETGFDDGANPGSTAATGSPAPSSGPAEAVRPPQRVAPAAPKFDDVPPPAPTPPNTQISANPPQP